MKNLGGFLISPNLNAFNGHQCDEMVEAALQTIERKMETALYLLPKEPWDCFVVVIGETDGIAHRLWKYHDKHSPLADEYSVQYKGEDPILRIYQQVDRYIGRLGRLVSADTTILIMSDHGHGGNSAKAIYLNTWLEELGILRFKMSAKGRVFTSLFGMARSMGLKIIPSTLKKMIFRKTQLANKVESSLRFSHIDWSHTRAYSEETPYFPTIWINVKGREPDGIVPPGKEYEEVREQIVQALERWVDPETGQRVVKKAHKREELYTGPFVDKFPDLIIEWNLDNGYAYLFKNSKSVQGKQKAIAHIDKKEKEKSKSGDHRDYGILIAAGNHVQKQGEVQGAELLDLPPTILHLVGLPIPADMDGKVLTQLFTDDYLASHPVCHTEGGRGEVEHTASLSDYSAEEEAAIKERLQGLGYIE
jgi:predicted AlkP superfamily phosphohydrolase/phosphomutase